MSEIYHGTGKVFVDCSAVGRVGWVYKNHSTFLFEVIPDVGKVFVSKI